MIAGIDVSTKQIALVLLEDEGTVAYAETTPLPEGGVWHSCRRLSARGRWGTVWLIGMEDPYGMSMRSVKALGMVTGAVLATLPKDVPVVPMHPSEWKRETCGVPNAKKGEVAAWVGRNWSNIPALVDQDTLDAYAIAYAARAVNARAVSLSEEAS